MNDVIVVMLLGLGLTLVGGVLLATRISQRLRLRRTPRTLAREARAGSTVKMVGRVVAREPVHAPLADVDCAYFQVTVRQESERDRERRMETQFTDREYAQGWELEDESGRIAVEPENAQFLYIRLREYSPDTAAWDPSIRLDLVSRYILTRSGDGTTLSEERLDLGATVVALGRVEEGPAGPVLTGGPDLELYGEEEHKLTAIKLSDLAGAVLVATGLLLCATWWTSERTSHSDEPPPSMKPMPIPRPPERTPSTPRHP